MQIFTIRLARASAALFSGLAMPLAFAPFPAWPLAILLPAVLFFLWLKDLPKQAAWHGLLFGGGMFTTGIYWIHTSFHSFGNVGLVFSLLLTASLVMICAAFIALPGYFSARCLQQRANGFAAVLLIPTGWTLMEWLRGWIFTGFPWLSLGYSQIDSPLSGLAPLVGVYGISLAVTLSATLLALALQRPEPRRSLAAGSILAAVWLGALLLSDVVWTSPQGPALRVSLLQGNIEQRLKWEPEQRLTIEDTYMEMVEENWGSDLIVLPETALPEFDLELRDLLEFIDEEAKATNTAVLIGIPITDQQQGERSYNGVIGLGATTGRYYKRHLVPFGEYMPFRELLPGLSRFLDAPLSDFSPGSEKETVILQVNGIPVGISVCYEDAFPAEILQALPEAQILVNVSNDGWFGDSLAPHQHLQMTRMRALETGRPLVRATNTGISAIISETGDLQASAGQFQRQSVRGEVQPRRGLTPFARSGHLPLAAILLLLLFAGCRVARKTAD